jgi:hypothetical protein
MHGAACASEVYNSRIGAVTYFFARGLYFFWIGRFYSKYGNLGFWCCHFGLSLSSFYFCADASFDAFGDLPQFVWMAASSKG